MSYHDTQDGLDATFDIEDGFVAAWVDSWPKWVLNAEDRSRAMEQAIKRTSDQEVKLLLRWVNGRDNRFEIK